MVLPHEFMRFPDGNGSLVVKTRFEVKKRLRRRIQFRRTA
jgi:hypothetical protein